MKKKMYNKPAVEVLEIKQTDNMMNMPASDPPQAKQSAVYMSEDVDEKP